MFGYSPYGAYSSPYGYGRATPSYSSPDADYLRALAQERAAQEQLLAARRAQEEARQRAERARLAQSRYGLPSRYNPLYDDLDDYEDHDSYDGGYAPYGLGSYAPTSRQRQAALEQERQRALQRELERRERERERERELERLRLEEEKRQLEEERRRLMEEERRQRLRAEELRRREQEYNRQRARQFDPLFGPFGWMPDEEEETVSPRTGRRSQTSAPGHRRGMASQGTPAAQPYLKPNGSASRSSSVPPRSAAPPSPMRPSASGSKAETGHFKVPIRTPSPKQKAPSPKPQEPQATPEQHDAARKIQEAYRAHTARASALRTIDEHRNKFAHLKAGFRFPTSLDFQTAPGAHDHISVPVDPAALAALVLADGVSVEEGRSRRPQLAYTSQNAPVHAYLEELNRLLSALDAVESGGDKEVREKRKGIVREVESEAERVEAVVGEVWSRWQTRQQSGDQQQASDTVKVAPGASQATAEQPTDAQQQEKAMDVEQPDQDTQSEAHLDQQPPPQPMQTEETERVDPGVHDAAPPEPTAEQPDEKHMDVELVDAEGTAQPVPTSQSIPGESSDADRPRTEDGDKMQVESSESAQPADAPAVPMDTDADPPVLESAPSPEVDIPDAETEREAGDANDVVAGRSGGLSVPGEVEAPPTPEIDIKDADEEDEPAAHSQSQSPTESSQAVTEPVHVHPSISAVVAESPSPESSPATQPKPEVRHFERSPEVEGESSTAGVEPDTPTLSPSHGDAESEEEGPGTPPLGPSPHIVVTPAEGHPGVRVELGTKEQSEQKGSAEEAHKMRMAGEQELF